VSKTVAQRLLAGEHAGCATWQDVAAKFGVNERSLRGVRSLLRAQGYSVELNTNLVATSSSLVVEARPHRDTDTDIDPSIQRWPSVAQFDAEEPAVDVVPQGHAIKGVSSLLGPDGEVKAQWVKTCAQNDERQAWLDAIRDIGAALPMIEPVSLPPQQDRDLLAVYPVGDPHIGLLAWREDSGEDFDLNIAERHLVGAFKHLVDLAPPAHEALLIFIGDTAHADGQANTTTKGTRVDVDSRTVKMARVIVRICRRAIDLALAKHGRVTMIVERGNHDELISAMIALGLSLLYEADSRVTIDTSPSMYHWFRWGKNLIGTHHGDKAKPMDLLGVMAVDRKEDWSETEHRRFYCGHFHHQIVKEVPGLIVEYLPTLASSDAWHHSMGYRSQRAMYMDVFHRDHGHINRHIVGIGQLRSAA
jgi:hypothetical protein